MNIRTLCLAILSFGESTGYEIRKSSIEGKYSHFVDASYGAIYPALNRLEQDGLVTCREEQQAGKPARKVYSITEAGREELVETLSQPPAKDTFRSAFLLIAMCAEGLPKSAIAAAIEKRERDLREELDQIASIRAHSSSDGTQWVCDYGLACMGRSLEHLNENKARLLDIAGTALPVLTPAEAAE